MIAPLAVSRYLRAALAYAAQGWFVFPLSPREKIPFRGTNGFQSATRNPEHITRAWGAHPDANIGLWPGPSGLTVIDVDGPAGEARATELGLFAEPTLVCHSGRDDGGRHLYFRAPDFPVSNVGLGDHLDVRGQGGYVVVPPSVHPTGRRYHWEGTAGEIATLPLRVLEMLRVGSDTAPEAERPRPITGVDKTEGGRNNALTRAAGNLLVKHPLAEATELLWGYNVAHCSPPLSRREVEGIITSLAKREAAKPSRLTDTGRLLTSGTPPERESPDLPDPLDLASGQVEAATARGRLDLSDAPRWQWADLHRLVGVMVPGDLIVVGALMGNGKTSFLLSQLDWNAEHGIPTLYLPLEVDPSDVRRRWAAWKLGLDYTHVARNDWHLLPEGSQDAHETLMGEQGRRLGVQFPPDRRVSLAKLAQWVRWGVDQIGARSVIVDHFHRMDFGGPTVNYRVQVTEAVRALKDVGREQGMAIIAAAQLNQDGDALDRYYPPPLRRLKESAGIGEEADTVLMLSRRLSKLLTADDMRALRAGHTSERDVEEPHTMVATCRKHRLDDEARDRSVHLHVENGRVVDRAPSWRSYHGRED